MSQLMDKEFKSLENKIDQLIGLYQQAREENIRLHCLLENAQEKNRQLAERMQTVAERLKILLNNLPGN